MKGRIFIATLAAASLLSFSAWAHGHSASNSSSIGQHGFGNVAGAGQVAVAGGKNTSTISQMGAFNFAATGQFAAFGGQNSSHVSQFGVGNVAVTSQAAF